MQLVEAFTAPSMRRLHNAQEDFPKTRLRVSASNSWKAYLKCNFESQGKLLKVPELFSIGLRENLIEFPSQAIDKILEVQKHSSTLNSITNVSQMITDSLSNFAAFRLAADEETKKSKNAFFTWRHLNDVTEAFLLHRKLHAIGSLSLATVFIFCVGS